MAKPFGVWGIDIGQCALKALRLEVIDGQPTATAFDYIEHPKILSQPDADPDALTREALEKFLSRNPLGKDQVAIGIAGQSGLARFVKLPPVEEKKIGDIVKFEAKQQIPFPLEEVVWDYQKIAGGEAVGGFAMETEIGLFAMKRDIINKYLGHYQAVGAEVHYVQMAPLALVNFATYELLKRGGPGGVEPGAPGADGEPDDTPRGKKRCTVVLDIGTDSSNLIITDGGKIIWQRPIPLGGNHFTRALTKEMKLTFAKAEHLKRNAAKSPDLAQILRALRPVLTEFVGEVQRSLGYFTNTHRDAHVAYLVGVGSAFKLPGLQKYLSEKLSLDVRKPSKLDRLSGDQVLGDPTFVENLLTFPVAYGLALQGLGLARLKTNLIPKEVVVERQIRAKKPAIAAAAAALLLGTGFLAIGKGVELASVTDPKIQTAASKAETAKKSADGQASDRSAKEGEVKATTDEVKAIIVGNDERLNWIRIEEILTAALPRHGYYDEKTGQEVAGTNLLDPDQIGYWNTQQGKRAYQKFRERMAAGVPQAKAADDDMAQHLAQVNVEVVYCRYTDKLSDFLTAADGYADRETATSITRDLTDAEREMDEALKRHKPKAVEGGGWVFEVRGYTYFKGPAGQGGGATNFLRHCLVRNLRNYEKFLGDGEKKIGEIIPGGKDPLKVDGKGTLSHVFLLNSQPAKSQTPYQSPLIANSLIDVLCTTGAAPAGGLPGGVDIAGGRGATGGIDAAAGMMQGTGASGTQAAAAPPSGPGLWKPLVGSAGGSGGGGGGFASFSAPAPGTGSDDGGLTPYVPRGGTIPAAPGGGAGGGAAIASRKEKDRQDFVVCFIWREPTPTDPTPAGSP